MITDEFEKDIAKFLNEETSRVPNYLAVGTTAITAYGPTDTDCDGEIGTRLALSNSRVDNVVEYSAIRSGATVIDTASGDSYGSVALFNTITQSTTDPSEVGIAVSGVTQTTNFDVEVVTNIRVNRA